jgi:sterol desaturase/sphingolipid hydroxylase (fatty acid hydroxylase superfamily)
MFMTKHLKEFFLFPDVLILCLALCAGLGWTVATFDAWAPLAFLLGMLLFAVSEYVTHRFFFHLPPPRHPFLLRLLKRLHYDHHERPQERELLFLPIWYSGPQLLLVGVLAYLVTSSLDAAIHFLSGAMAYHLYYEWKHFVAHRPIRPLTPWGRKMKRLHLLHHFKNENYWFGVTEPVLDQWFGTFPDEDKVELSPTARKLSEKPWA